MSRLGWMGTLRAGTALGILIIATAQANAGAFAIREQSTYGQGTSFAGVAAGGALSSMFWNPATMTQFQGIVSENGLSAHLSSSRARRRKPGSTLAGPPFFFGGVSNSGEMRVRSRTATRLIRSARTSGSGLAINAPFGLSVSFPGPWAGRNYRPAIRSMKTYNATPSIAYRINDWISVGAGVQIQYASRSLDAGCNIHSRSTVDTLDGKGWGFGATAGVTFTPWPNDDDRTRVALGDQSGHPRHAHWCLAGIAVSTSGSAEFNGQPSRHRQPWYSPALRPLVDSHGYGRVE